jgi:ABC-type antimicrobial peptide transport system permease subunit
MTSLRAILFGRQKARGHSRISIIWRELLPNVLDTLMVEGAMRWSWMLLAFSSLSFLGFGVSPPTPDWGIDDFGCARLYVLCPMGRDRTGHWPVITDYWH